jgi:hypothetical protein
MASWDS